MERTPILPILLNAFEAELPNQQGAVQAFEEVYDQTLMVFLSKHPDCESNAAFVDFMIKVTRQIAAGTRALMDRKPKPNPHRPPMPHAAARPLVRKAAMVVMGVRYHDCASVIAECAAEAHDKGSEAIDKIVGEVCGEYEE